VSARVYVRPPTVTRRTVGVERGEQDVPRHRLCPGEPVQQRRLASVGVTGDRHRRHLVAGTAAAGALSPSGQLRGAFAQQGRPPPQPAPLHLQAHLARAAHAHAGAVRHPAAADPRQRPSFAAQPRELVRDLGQLHLQTPFALLLSAFRGFDYPGPLPHTPLRRRDGGRGRPVRCACSSAVGHRAEALTAGSARRCPPRPAVDGGRGAGTGTDRANGDEIRRRSDGRQAQRKRMVRAEHPPAALQGVPLQDASLRRIPLPAQCKGKADR
jgi:hypothetical protein